MMWLYITVKPFIYFLMPQPIHQSKLRIKKLCPFHQIVCMLSCSLFLVGSRKFGMWQHAIDKRIFSHYQLPEAALLHITHDLFVFRTFFPCLVGIKSRDNLFWIVLFFFTVLKVRWHPRITCSTTKQALSIIRWIIFSCIIIISF